MHFNPVSLLASVLWILGATGASADGRIALTSAELDDVTPVARYAPAQVGELLEAAVDGVTFELDRLRRYVAREINGADPARPMAGVQAMPAIAPPATSAPATPARQASVPSRQVRSEAVWLPHVPRNRSFSSDHRFSPRQ